MKYKKTPQSKRGTYKLFDDDGNFVTEYKPCKDGVTEIDILNLHKMDDHEVYINNKDRRLPEWYKPAFDVWKENFIKSFKEEYGREPYRSEIPKAHRQYISIESQMDANGDELGDSSRLEAELAVYDDADDESDAVTRLNEVIAGMLQDLFTVIKLMK